jgi:hypothetical protein
MWLVAWPSSDGDELRVATADQRARDVEAAQRLLGVAPVVVVEICGEGPG